MTNPATIAKGLTEGSRVMEWMPIESAPKDGTTILAVMCGHHPDTGKPFEPAVVSWEDGFGWIERPEDLVEYSPHDWSLTHWMPIPPAPYRTNDAQGFE